MSKFNKFIGSAESMKQSIGKSGDEICESISRLRAEVQTLEKSIYQLRETNDGANNIALTLLADALKEKKAQLAQEGARRYEEAKERSACSKGQVTGVETLSLEGYYDISAQTEKSGRSAEGTTDLDMERQVPWDMDPIATASHSIELELKGHDKVVLNVGLRTDLMCAMLVVYHCTRTNKQLVIIEEPKEYVMWVR